MSDTIVGNSRGVDIPSPTASMADQRLFVPVTEINRNAALCNSISLKSLAEPYSASFCVTRQARAKRAAAMVIIVGRGRELLVTID
jgi:hypothetical protein